jgi:hypothetical protein
VNLLLRIRTLLLLPSVLSCLVVLPACSSDKDPPHPATPDAPDAGTPDAAAPDAAAPDGGPSSTCDKPRWDVPSVSRDDLDKHDLKWIGCELTACGPADKPASPGEPSILCAPPPSAGVPITYLGRIHPNESGAFTTSNVISPSNINWLDGPRHIYKSHDNVYIFTEADEVKDQLEVFYATRAIDILSAAFPSAYKKLVTETASIPSEPPLGGRTWKNRIRSFVISFDTSPAYIAASVTVLDNAPVTNTQTGLDEYSNVAAVSIDRETILGQSDTVGSRPIYGKPSADENFLRYMREGLVETIVHELLHRYIDRLNSVDDRMINLYTGRTNVAACQAYAFEETLVASASLLSFRQAGGLGGGYLDYYDKVVDANLELIKACPEYPTWVQQFSKPSGVHPRYDLRLIDLK